MLRRRSRSRFNFRSEAPWLKVVSGDRYIRGDMGMTVACRYDDAKLQEMGAYSARIIATLDGGDLGGLAGREFFLWNTVVVGDTIHLAAQAVNAAGEFVADAEIFWAIIPALPTPVTMILPRQL